MKYVRCKNCGMSIKIDDEQVVTCPICDKKNLVMTCEEVPSFDDLVAGHFDSTEHQKEHVFEIEDEVKENFHKPKNKNQNVNPIVVMAFAFLITVFFMMLIIFGGE